MNSLLIQITGDFSLIFLVDLLTSKLIYVNTKVSAELWHIVSMVIVADKAVDYRELASKFFRKKVFNMRNFSKFVKYR